MKTHFVYAGHHYYDYWNSKGREDRLRAIISKGMRKYKLKSVMVTSINLHKWNLITKEEMEQYCKGERDRKDSVNDDLESLFQNIRLGKEPEEWTHTYLLPKLTPEELKLVEEKNRCYFQTFYFAFPFAESDSKFAQSMSGRRTFTIENSSEKQPLLLSCINFR